MVTTAVRTRVKVQPHVHATVYVANELIRIIQDLVNLRSLPTDYMHQHGSLFSDSFRYWIAGRHLKRLTLEIYLPDTDQLIERFDLALDYDHTADDEYFETLTDKVRDSIASLDSLPEGCRYRVVVSLTEDAPNLPGWSKTEYRDANHLRQKNIGLVIGSPRIGVSLELWFS